MFALPYDQMVEEVTTFTSMVPVLDLASVTLTLRLGKACWRVFCSLTAGPENPQLLQYSILTDLDIIK